MRKEEKRFKRNDKKSRLFNFIFVPIMYAILSLFVFGFFTSFVLGDFSEYSEKFFLDKAPTFIEEIKDDFVPAKKITQKTLPLEEVEFPLYGSVFGKIKIPSIKLDCSLIYGDDEECLKKGACQYNGSFIPGYGGVTLISGHNYYPFENLNKVKRGDNIEITTTYGVYTYKVNKTLITSSLNPYAYDLAKKDNSVILYTCERQNNSLGNVLMRKYIYAKMVYGPVLVK